MKKTLSFLFAALTLASPAAMAQYVCTTAGTTLTYAQTIKAGDESMTATEVCKVDSVAEAADVVSVVINSETTNSKNPLATKTEKKRYAYNKATGITTIYEGSPEDVKAEIVSGFIEEMASQGQTLSESDLKKINDGIHVRGELFIEIPDDASAEYKNKNKTMRVTMGPQTITNSMWSIKIEGTEQQTTPAGTFDCVKVSYTLKINMGQNSMKINTTDWYAKGIGLVRSVSDSSELKTTSELQKITQP